MEVAPVLAYVYRTCREVDPATPGSFWTTSREYARYVHDTWPLFRAMVRRSARVERCEGSPDRRALGRMAKRGVQVAIFAAWDWDTDEFVVLDPDVLEDVREIRANAGPKRRRRNDSVVPFARSGGARARRANPVAPPRWLRNALDALRAASPDLRHGYDVRFAGEYDALYHATPSARVDDILRNGLEPRAEAKLRPHPPGVYMVGDEVDAWRIAYQLNAALPRAKRCAWTILRVDPVCLGRATPLRVDEQACREQGVYATQGVHARCLRVETTLDRLTLLARNFPRAFKERFYGSGLRPRRQNPPEDRPLPEWALTSERPLRDFLEEFDEVPDEATLRALLALEEAKTAGFRWGKIGFPTGRSVYVTHEPSTRRRDTLTTVYGPEAPYAPRLGSDFLEDRLFRDDWEDYFGDTDTKFNDDFWQWPYRLFHGTRDLSGVLRGGIEPRTESRGINNRSVADAVFTSLSEEAARAYGTEPGGGLVVIDTAAMKRDGVTPQAAQEPEVREKSLAEAMAHRLGVEYEAEYSDAGIDPETVILYGRVPARYLAVIEDHRTGRRKRR